MVELTDKDMRAAIGNVTLYKKIDTGAIAALAVLALVTATLAATDAGPGELVLVLAGIALLLSVSILIFNLLLVRGANGALKKLLARNIAQSLSGAVTPEEGAHYIAEYEGNIFTLSIQGGGALASFNLTPLKKVPAHYSSFGALIKEYLDARCISAGVQNAAVEDATGDEVHTLTLGERPENNYYFKKDLLQ